MYEITCHLKNKSGNLATGLTPLISIVRVSDNALLVDAQAMTELRLGFYKYGFAAYDPAQKYLILVDSTLTGAARYASGVIVPFERGLEEIIESDVKGKHALAALMAYTTNHRSGGGTGILEYSNVANDLVRIRQLVNEQGEVSDVVFDVSDIP